MNYYGIEEEIRKYALAHHGIKGQKWGVRRYQNPDGTYTSEGKVRKRAYRESLKSNSKKNTTSEDEERIRGPLSYSKSNNIRYTIAKKLFPKYMSDVERQDYNRFLQDVNEVGESRNDINTTISKSKADKKISNIEYKTERKKAERDIKNVGKMKRMEMEKEKLKNDKEKADIMTTKAQAKRLKLLSKIEKAKIKADLQTAEAMEEKEEGKDFLALLYESKARVDKKEREDKRKQKQQEREQKRREREEADERRREAVQREIDVERNERAARRRAERELRRANRRATRDAERSARRMARRDASLYTWWWADD